MQLFNRLLQKVEQAGNRLPDPVTLFLLLAILTCIFSYILAIFQVSVIHPSTGKTLQVVNLFSADMLRRLLIEMPITFAAFPPLGIVLTVMLGIGVAEKSGFIAAVLRQLLNHIPQRLLSMAVVFAGIMSSMATDAGYVVLIPLGAVLFINAGRHPLAGLAAAFAGVSAGFSANLLLTSLDPLLAGFTQSAAQLLDENYQVNAAANYYLMVTLVPVFTLLGSWVTDRLVEPRLVSINDNWQQYREPIQALSARQKQGLVYASLSILALLIIFACLVLPEQALLRDAAGSIQPFYHALIALMLLLFLIPGLVYGVFVGKITSDRDAVAMTGESMSDMGMYIVLAFVAAHFIALFKWSNLGAILAIAGADTLQSIGLTGIPLIIGFIALAALINIFVGSASAKWAVMGPVFVPMLMLLGYTPEFAQAAYRIGDAFTNVLTPLLPYFPLIIVFARRYANEFGMGNLIALMLPYSLCFGIFSTLVLCVWVAFGWPLGPGAVINY